MKKLILKEILLLSKKEGKAKQIKFDADRTVITGRNNTGKSSLIKSIYHSLGADVDYHPKWKGANVTCLLKFELNDKEYNILRFQNLFGVFDNELNLIKAAQGITTGIGPYLTSLYEFEIQLKQSSSQKYVIPTPVFQYLPYYVDQDKGWAKPWDSFENLSHFSGWKSDIINYHSGIKPKEYYELSALIGDIKTSYKEKEAERTVIINAQSKIEKERPPVSFDIDINSYKKEIEYLLKKCNELHSEEEKYRKKLSDLRSQEIILQNQLDIAKTSLKEIEKDYEFTLKITESHVDCPICGTEFENSLINRFSLVEDAEACREMILEINEKLKELRKKIEPIEKEFMDNKNKTKEINKILEEKKGAIKLHDLIQSESQKEIRKIFRSRIDSYSEELGKLYDDEKKYVKERKIYTDKERSRAIKDTYNGFMGKFLPALDVYGLTEDDYKDMPSKVKEKGSDHPRAMMAYYYSFLHTIKQHSTSYFFPIVIDSPNQQDQDDQNVPRIMNFVLNKKPESSQLILGTVELHGAKYDGYLIELPDKYSLLSKKEYEEVDSIISPLFNTVLDDIT